MVFWINYINEYERMWMGWYVYFIMRIFYYGDNGLIRYRKFFRKEIFLGLEVYVNK